MKESLSTRGKSLVRDMPPLTFAHYNIADKLYDKDTNPEGYINMGTAETHLINNELIELLDKIENRMELTPEHLHYDYFYGSVEFRTAIANYWQKLIFKNKTDRKITKDNVSIGSGCSLALEMLATMLGNEGDVALVPAPYYSGFVDDFTDRAGVELIPVHCGENMDRDIFEKAYNEQIERGKRIACILYSSPNNPIGNVYSKEALETVIKFAMDKDLDIVSDEIYAQTIHEDGVEWVSTMDLVPDEYLERVHVTSSFAKDFALSGFRTGFVISFNMDLLTGMHNLAYYSGVSTHTQAVLTQLLEAPELPELLKSNKEQLHIGYTRMVEALNEIGVETMPAQGGIFIMANFENYMDDKTWDGEYALWEKIYNDLKINISPGKIFATDSPGWYRICFAHDEEIVKEACRRLLTLKK